MRAGMPMWQRVTACVMVWMVAGLWVSGACAQDTAGEGAAANGEAAVQDLVQDGRTFMEVNGAPVPRWMFDNAMRDRIRQAESTGKALDEARRSELAREVLDNLIQMELLTAEAVSKGVEANRAAGELRVGIIEAQSGTRKAFEARLRNAGMTREQYVEIWRQQVSVNRLVEEVIQPGIQIPPADLRARYFQDVEKLVVPPRVRLAELFIPLPKHADDALRQQAMDALRQERETLTVGTEPFMAVAGERAGVLAQRFPGATVREVGWIYAERNSKVVPQDVREGAAGHLGQPVGSGKGVHLHYVLEAQPQRTASFEEVQEEMEKQLREERTPTAIADYTRTLRESATIKMLMELP